MPPSPGSSQVVDPDASVTVWEKEDRLAAHQTGRNSGVVHAGLYYQPGSLKATLCRRGVGMLREFCEEHAIAYDECGKVLVALDEVEEGRLGAIEEKAPANGVPGVRRISGDELREIEPHVRGRGRAALADHGDRRLPRRHPQARRAGRARRRHGPALDRDHRRSAPTATASC